MSINNLLGEPEPQADSSLPSSRSESRKGGKSRLSNLTSEQKAKRRAMQLVEAKRKQRARQASMGDRVVTITLTANEAALLRRLRDQQRGPVEGFERRALLIGAAFAANSGTPRGKKAKGNVGAAAIRGHFVDTSTNPQRGVAGERLDGGGLGRKRTDVALPAGAITAVRRWTDEHGRVWK